MTDGPDRHAIALVLDEIGVLMELLGENRFKARAFASAARAMDALEGDVAALARTGALRDVRGFGPATASVAREIVETGCSSLHAELRARTPSGLVDMLAVPGLGATRIHTLHAELGVETLDDLADAAAAGRIAQVSGFGARTQSKILEGVAFVRSTAGRRRQPRAYEAAARILGWLDESTDAAVKVAGELRRRLETVDGVDLVAGAEDAGAVLASFQALPGLAARDGAAADGAPVDGGAGRGAAADASAAHVPTAAGRLADGMEVRLSIGDPPAFGALWIVATGSEAHVSALRERARERGLRLQADGLFRGEERVEGADEASVYEALGLPWIPPELREGDVAPYEAGVPTLLESSDLRGTFHCHTTWSDGKATVREMAEGALARGWRYLGIADHSPNAAYAGGLSPADVARQQDEIDAWNEERGGELWLFKGTEADILTDGTLDYAAEGDVLERFDYVVASVHSSFGIGRKKMTARVLKALEDPHLTFLGHPTGRLLLSRDAYEIDMEAVIARAAELGRGIEINADPARLDMDWRRWPAARESGVKTAINPDAHSVRGLDNVEYGVGMARKAGLGPADVVNAWKLEDVRRYLGLRE